MTAEHKRILLYLIKIQGNCKRHGLFISCKRCPFNKDTTDYTFICTDFDLLDKDVDKLIVNEAKKLLLIHEPSSLFDIAI